MFGEKIKQYRENNSYSQRDLAEILGVSIRTVVRWEQDKSKPNPEDVKRIASLMGISEEELLNDSKDSGINLVREKKQSPIEKISDGVDNLVSGQETLNESLMSNRDEYIKKQDELIKELRDQNKQLLVKMDEQSAKIESYKMELEQSKLQSRHGRIRTTVIVITCLIVILFTVGTWLYIMNYGFKGEINEGSASIETVYYYHIDDEQINQGG